jgi:UDP-N-acetylmuramyl pentapeptide phosphotransferase/UDP-N-acetylglucosamine-1-phosphate transferase
VSRGLRRVAAGALTARVGLSVLTRWPPGGADRWTRPNHRGATVTLLAGSALVVATATTGPGVAAAVAAVGSGAAGALDDARGGADGAKGLGGHLAALRDGRLTTGSVKVLAITTTGLVAASCLRPRRAADVLLAGSVIAGSANLLNLLDFRPGRALKAGIAAGIALGQPGVVGSCAALLPGDLAERQMLGDTGANALGAVLGVALVTRLRSRSLRAAALTALVALTAASERVSFSEVIDRSPVLRWLDRLGRLA